MSSSANEDQEQRKSNGMADSNAMTIEFLRARLLSERSVSKAARQRADELAMRVAELEDQLKFVSHQRMKAEKATVDVLAILENHGLSDVTEGFDSCSDQDETSHALMVHNDSRDPSTNNYSKKDENKADSSSDLDSSPSTGRSLSWKSTKEPTFSLERKKHIEAVRRRCSYASSSSSARRIGKSCRRIRRKESSIRSAENLQNENTESATCSGNILNCYDGEFDEVGETARYDTGKQLEYPADLNNENQNKEVDFSGPERSQDIESALQHQAQLIGQYEEEEKAQRVWEEKFRENHSATQDSGDPGIHSDVTEDFEMKSTELLHAAVTMKSINRETKQEPVKPNISKSMPSFLDVHTKGSLQGEKCNGMLNGESSGSASEFSFPTSKEGTYGDLARKKQEILERCQECTENSSMMHSQASAVLSYNQTGQNRLLYGSAESPSSSKLAAVPEETSNNLGLVLESLQKAKLSLNQKLNTSLLVHRGNFTGLRGPSIAETNYADSFNIPVTRGLFRLPTDNRIDSKMGAGYHGMGALSSFDQFSPKISGNRSVSESGARSTRAFSSDVFATAPQTLSTGMRSVVPPQRSFSQPRMSVGLSSNRVNEHGTRIILSTDYSYPFPSDISHVPLNEGISSMVPSSDMGLPPFTRLPCYDLQVTRSPLYDDLVRRPDIYK